MARERLTGNDFYEIEVDSEKNRLYLTVKGYWRALTDVSNYLQDLQSAVDRLLRGFTIVTDVTQAKTSSEEAGVLHIKAQEYIVQAGLSRTAEIHPESKITCMALNRYARTSGMDRAAFASLEEAEAWLDGG